LATALPKYREKPPSDHPLPAFRGLIYHQPPGISGFFFSTLANRFFVCVPEYFCLAGLWLLRF